MSILTSWFLGTRYYLFKYVILYSTIYMYIGKFSFSINYLMVVHEIFSQHLSNFINYFLDVSEFLEANVKNFNSSSVLHPLRIFDFVTGLVCFGHMQWPSNKRPYSSSSPTYVFNGPFDSSIGGTDPISYVTNGLSKSSIDVPKYFLTYL